LAGWRPKAFSGCLGRFLTDLKILLIVRKTCPWGGSLLRLVKAGLQGTVIE
jgi:hypothetical protein